MAKYKWRVHLLAEFFPKVTKGPSPSPLAGDWLAGWEDGARSTPQPPPIMRTYLPLHLSTTYTKQTNPKNKITTNSEPGSVGAELQPRAENPAPPPAARQPRRVHGHGVDLGVGKWLCVRGEVLWLVVGWGCRLMDWYVLCPHHYHHPTPLKHTSHPIPPKNDQFPTLCTYMHMHIGRCCTSWCTWRLGSTATSSIRGWRGYVCMYILYIYIHIYI